MLRLADNKVYIVSLKPHDKYISGSVSTGRNAAKKDETPDWKNSFWNISFVSKAFEKAKKLGAKDRILILGKQCQLTAEPYTDNEGVLVYPKPTLLVFDFDFLDNKTSSTNSDKKKVATPTAGTGFDFD